MSCSSRSGQIPPLSYPAMRVQYSPILHACCMLFHMKSLVSPMRPLRLIDVRGWYYHVKT